MHLAPAVPVEYINFGIAGGAKYELVCNKHGNKFHTKNPWQRSMFVANPTDNCYCSPEDMTVTFIPDDLTSQPYGGRHFKSNTPAVYLPKPPARQPDRTIQSYWKEHYPNTVTQLGNLSRLPHPADVFTHVASRIPNLTDAEVIEKVFTNYI
jgi:hypothetical protein